MLRLNLRFKNWKKSSSRGPQHLRVTKQDQKLGHVVSISRAKWIFFDVKVINPNSTSTIKKEDLGECREAESLVL